MGGCLIYGPRREECLAPATHIPEASVFKAQGFVVLHYSETPRNYVRIQDVCKHLPKCFPNELAEYEALSAEQHSIILASGVSLETGRTDYGMIIEHTEGKTLVQVGAADLICMLVDPEAWMLVSTQPFGRSAVDFSGIVQALFTQSQSEWQRHFFSARETFKNLESLIVQEHN